ncbi:phage tail protein [Fusibacter sp. 3D3]|uniref:phage tail protein n=1 Tax=Fusibacter sp. 3D3 TaxID=1048380 RepID=UPI00085367F6|nr:tail fiber protein [Fusibacter sp. 3D3]GAU78716.1 microcystin dependent protein [Fusibacter sp. 3D3]
MLDPLIGTIMPWGATFAPVGWLRCDGSTLVIQQYQALYSLIGITYGGDGRTTFKLPNLSACVPIGMGSTSIGGLYVGMTIGSDSSTVIINENTMPAHSHAYSSMKVNLPEQEVNVSWEVSQNLGERPAPQENDYLGGSSLFLYRDTIGQSVNLSGISGTAPAVNGRVKGDVSSTGMGSPIQLTNVQPVLGFDFIIAYDGIYPERP